LGLVWHTRILTSADFRTRAPEAQSRATPEQGNVEQTRSSR
jgi:hypothetical protein